MNRNKKPKILFLVQLPPPVHGASLMNQYLLNSKTLNEAFEKEVLNLDFVTKVSEIGTFSLGKLIKMMSFSILLLKTLLKSKYDLVYFTLSPVGGAFYRDVLFVFILRLFGSKIIYHLHGKGISEEIKNPIKKRIYAFVFKKSSVICLSKLLHYDIEDVFKGTIYDVANGIPVVKKKNLKKNFNEIVYLSALKRSKGILDFVEALKILNFKHIDFQVKIIGSSTNDLSIEELKRIIDSYKLDNKVCILGPIYGDDKYIELSSSGIFCFPTFYKNECFPLSILEAMMMGVVPVSTNNGAIEEIIDHKRNGMIVSMQQPEQLANTLYDLLTKTKEEMLELSGNAKNKFNKYYTISVFEESIVNVFKKVLNHND